MASNNSTPPNTDANTDTNTTLASDATNTAAEPAPTAVKISVSGKISEELQATAGSTLRRAFLDSGKFGERQHENFSYTDENGKAVSLDRNLSTDLKLTAVARSSGG